MNVIDSLEIGDGHIIEWGHSTWDPAAVSIRDRYPTATGGFSPHSSSELPIQDLEHLVTAASNWNLLDSHSMARMIEALAVALRRHMSRI
ncbi:unnamed protein product [marine sediment metagenome]|uniref:Uncharacterized protein n=1 Tax=marine sediment metagenome TaxID=412755 RepID=X1I1L1_9ZZZZ